MHRHERQRQGRALRLLDDAEPDPSGAAGGAQKARASARLVEGFAPATAPPRHVPQHLPHAADAGRTDRPLGRLRVPGSSGQAFR